MSKRFRLGSILSLFLLFLAGPLWAQTTLTPDEAIDKLLKGNQRFITGKMIFPHRGEGRRLEIKQGQTPFVAILSCSDSRVPNKIIFDQGLGDIFVARVAGNTPDDFVIGSLEYGAAVLKVPLILVLGHEKCGAVEASMKPGPLPGHVEEIGKAIRPAIKGKTCKKKNQLSCAIQNNVTFVVERLKNSQPILAPLVEAGKLKVVGATYDLATGKVSVLP